jgi:ParB family chromosome partitioning protein
MGKEAFLHKKLGGALAASIGVREAGHLELVDRSPEVKEDRQAGRSRMREAGYMLLENIVPDPTQVRTEFNQTAIENLSKSLKRFGMLQPIEVRWDEASGKHIVMHGERRYRAAKLAGLESIPCIFREGELTESEIKQRQLTENCLREDLTPMEQARAFKELMSLNSWTTYELAEALCLSQPLVSQRMSLFSLDEAVQQQIASGDISGAAGYHLAQLADPREQVEVASEVVAGKLNRDEVISLVKERKSRGAAAGRNSGKTKDAKQLLKEKSFKTSKATIVVKLKGRGGSEAEMLAAVEELASRLREELQKVA